MATVRTVTVKSTGGDYTSLANAEAGEQGDLVALDRQLDIECHAFTDSLADTVTVDGSITDATRYIRIAAAAGAESTGAWQASGAYTLEVSGGTYTMLLSDPFTRVERIQVERINQAASDYGIHYGTDDCVIDGLMIKGGGAGTADIAMRLWGARSVARNCVVFGNWTNGLDAHAPAGGSTVENCTAYSVSVGFTATNANMLIRNCVAYGCGTADFDGTAASGSNNASSDATALGANSLTAIADPFVDAVNSDFHLASGSALIDAGLDLSTDFTTDIDGETRTGTWDIGADEYVASGPTKTLDLPSALSFTLDMGSGLGAAVEGAATTAARSVRRMLRRRRFR